MHGSGWRAFLLGLALWGGLLTFSVVTWAGLWHFVRRLVAAADPVLLAALAAPLGAGVALVTGFMAVRSFLRDQAATGAAGRRSGAPQG